MNGNPNFLGTGWGFPVRLDSEGQFIKASEHSTIEASIKLILSTATGERLMRPDFGSTLHTFLFKPVNDSNRAQMSSAVKIALQRWEPRIKISQITVSPSPTDLATVHIDVEYRIRRTNVRANLVYPFYVGEASA